VQEPTSLEAAVAKLFEDEEMGGPEAYVRSHVARSFQRAIAGRDVRPATQSVPQSARPGSSRSRPSLSSTSSATSSSATCSCGGRRGTRSRSPGSSRWPRFSHSMAPATSPRPPRRITSGPCSFIRARKPGAGIMSPSCATGASSASREMHWSRRVQRQYLARVRRSTGPPYGRRRL
jgi:hypothetical protein